MSSINTIKRWPLLSISMFKNDSIQSKIQGNEVKLVKKKWESNNECTYFIEHHPVELCIKMVKDNISLNDLLQYGRFKPSNDIGILETISLSKTDIAINKLKVAIRGSSISFKYCKFGPNYRPETVKFQIKLLKEEDAKELIDFLKKYVNCIISSQSTENTLSQNDINLEVGTSSSLYQPPPFNNTPFINNPIQENLSNYITSPLIEGHFNIQSTPQNYTSIHNNNALYNPNSNLSHSESKQIEQSQDYFRIEEELSKIQDIDEVTKKFKKHNKIESEQNEYNNDEGYIEQELKKHLQNPAFKEYVDKVEKVILKMTKE